MLSFVKKKPKQNISMYGANKLKKKKLVTHSFLPAAGGRVQMKNKFHRVSTDSCRWIPGGNLIKHSFEDYFLGSSRKGMFIKWSRFFE